MTYSYVRKVRWGYMVPALASLLLAGVFAAFIIEAVLFPDSYAANGLRLRNVWFPVIWGVLVAWTVAACVPPMFRHYRSFVLNGSLRVIGLLRAREYPWTSIREMQ